MFKNTFKGICEFNITIIGVNILFDSYLLIDEKNSKVNGIFKKSWDIFLGTKKRCKIIAADTYDDFNNDTIKSAFSYYRDKKGDLLLNAQTLYIVSDYGEYSYAISQDSYKILHPFYLNTQIKNELDVIQMMDIDLSYLILFLISTFLTLIFILFILKIKTNEIIYRIDTIKKLFFSYLFDLKQKNIFIISFILILLGYLNQMTKNFLINSIKSSRVVADTDLLLNSLDDIAKTNRFFCELEEDEIWIFYRQLNSTIYKLISNKDTGGCFVRKEMNDEQRIALDLLHKNGFLVSDSVALHFLINAFSKFYKNSKYWVSDSLFESILALYIRKDLNSNLKKEINNFCSHFMQFGISKKISELNHFVVRQLYGFHKGELNIFNSIKKYREANQELIILKFESFEITFVLLFTIQFVIIFIFILSIRQKIKKFLIIIIRKFLLKN